MVTSENGFDSQDGGDAEIEDLLASTDPLENKRGLELLDMNKRRPFCIRLRKLSNDHNWNLTAEDLADIWQETLLSILEVVSRGRFKRNRGIDGFIYKLLRCRAIDNLRVRFRALAVRRNSQLRSVGGIMREDADEEVEIHFVPLLVDFVLERSRRCKLSPKETCVIRHYTTLLLAFNKYPTPEDLTFYVNAERRSKQEKRLSEAAVQSAKARAIKKLRNQ